MLNSFDFGIAISLALCYNLLAHCINSNLYDNMDFVDKHNYSIVTLMILAVVALVISKLIYNRINKTGSANYTDSVLCMGFAISALLLLTTTILIDWNNLNEVTQVIIMGITIIAISYYVYCFC